MINQIINLPKRIIQKIKEILFPTKEEEQIYLPIRIDLGIIEIMIEGVPRERNYEEAKKIFNDVKRTYSEYPLYVNEIDRMGDPHGFYPRVYINDQLWTIGRVKFNVVFDKIRHIIDTKKAKIRDIISEFEKEKTRNRYFLCFSQAYFRTGIGDMRNVRLVPTSKIHFTEKDLAVSPLIERHGKGVIEPSKEELEVLEINQNHFFDFRPYDKHTATVIPMEIQGGK